MFSAHKSFRRICLALLVLSTLLTQDLAAQATGERATEIKADIARDEERLEWLRSDTEETSKLFDIYTTRAAELDLQLDETQRAIAELGGEETPPDPVKLAELRLRAKSLEERSAQESRRAALVADTVRISRREIALLEEKIARGRDSLDLLLGIEQADSEESESVLKAREEQTASDTSGPSLQLPGLTRPEESQETPTDEAQGLGETARQIQARKNAERAQQEKIRAEQQLLEFVERRQTLQEQIDVEKSQLGLAAEARIAVAEELAGVDNSDSERIAELEGLREEITAVEKDSRAELEKLEADLEQLTGRQSEIAREVEDKTRESEEALKAERWAFSPLNPDNILRWVKLRGPGILVTLAVMIALLLATRFAARRTIRFLVRSTHTTERPLRAQRAETIATSLGAVVTGVVMVIAIAVVLSEAGVQITAVLGGAAILGVAVAFGAQNLMKDYFNGIMILLEDQYGLDDLVTIGTVEGRIERVSLRTTVVRDVEGRLHFLPNGQITHVTNRSYQWSRAVFDIPVPYDCDLDRVMEMLMEEANEFCRDSSFTRLVADQPVMLGVDQFAESSIIIRFYIKTAPSMHLPVRREMLRRVKIRFDREGISIPFPHRVVISGDATP